MRIFADGVFDFYHRGHREHFHRLKAISSDVHLIIGVISDKECAEYKRTPSMNEHSRLELVSRDKNVDKALITQLIITKDFLDTHKIDFVYHAFADASDATKQTECFRVPREMGIFRTVPYVTGVSSSEILSSWEHIWEKKGGVDTNDLQLLNGYEGTSFDPKEAWAKICKTMDMHDSDEILEVGCGAGFVAQHVHQKYVGIDPSESLVMKHISILQNPVCVGYAHDIPFKDNSFDYVVVIGICAYFKDKAYTQAAIQEWQRVARKGVYVGNIRYAAQPRRDKHIYSGPTTHLLHDQGDFPEFTKGDALYDDQYYFCCFKKF